MHAADPSERDNNAHGCPRRRGRRASGDLAIAGFRGSRRGDFWNALPLGTAILTRIALVIAPARGDHDADTTFAVISVDAVGLFVCRRASRFAQGACLVDTAVVDTGVHVDLAIALIRIALPDARRVGDARAETIADLAGIIDAARACRLVVGALRAIRSHFTNACQRALACETAGVFRFVLTV